MPETPSNLKTSPPVWDFSDPDALASLYAPPEDPGSEPQGEFPLGWYREFLEVIRERGIEVITYDDLFAGSDDWDYRDHYRSEFTHWRRHRRDPKKTYLLIQHDVDNHPFFTQRMAALEAAYGIRSNIFIFRNRYSANNPDPPYPIDHGFFQAAERAGFVIGYHQNALQLAGFDMERAAERYRADVRALSERYDIRHMVPHGGRGAEIDGVQRHNFDVPMPAELEGRIRWVFNRYGATFKDRWSDGGIRRSRDAKRIAKSDIINSFLMKLKPGTRNFCLVHPQRWGYHVGADRNPMLAEQAWYRDMCARHASTHYINNGEAVD